MRSRPRASIPPALTPVLTGRWPEQWEALLEELLAARSSSHASHAGRGRADRLGAGLSWTATAWTVLLATSASAPRAVGGPVVGGAPPGQADARSRSGPARRPWRPSPSCGSWVDRRAPAARRSPVVANRDRSDRVLARFRGISLLSLRTAADRVVPVLRCFLLGGNLMDASTRPVSEWMDATQVDPSVTRVAFAYEPELISGPWGVNPYAVRVPDPSGMTVYHGVPVPEPSSMIVYHMPPES